MAKVRTAGAGSSGLLQVAMKDAASKIGKQASALAAAKKGGAGIGGLLGSVVGFLVAGPVGAAIGGGLGALGGSKIGGATSGTSQGDIMSNKLYTNTTVDISRDIAKSEFMDVGMAAISGAMNAGSIGKGLKGFAEGAKGLKGLKGLMGGLKGLGTSFMSDEMKEKIGEEGLKGIGYEGLDKALGGWLPGGEKLTGKAIVGQAKGLGKAAFNTLDTAAGGFLPGGVKPIGKGYGEDVKGLLGYGASNSIDSNDTPMDNTPDTSVDMNASNDTSAEGLGAEQNAYMEKNVGINLDQPDFNNPEWVKQFQKRVMGMQEGDSGFGQFGPMTTEAYQNWKYNQSYN